MPGSTCDSVSHQTLPFSLTHSFLEYHTECEWAWSLYTQPLRGPLLQFFKRIVGDPPGCARIQLFDRLRPLHRHGPKMAIAFPDLPQGPVHRFFHQIALIDGILLGQWEKRQKRFVKGSL